VKAPIPVVVWLEIRELKKSLQQFLIEQSIDRKRHKAIWTEFFERLQLEDGGIISTTSRKYRIYGKKVR
jgi:hypothetical protein